MRRYWGAVQEGDSAMRKIVLAIVLIVVALVFVSMFGHSPALSGPIGAGDGAGAGHKRPHGA